MKGTFSCGIRHLPCFCSPEETCQKKSHPKIHMCTFFIFSLKQPSDYSQTVLTLKSADGQQLDHIYVRNAVHPVSIIYYLGIGCYVSVIYFFRTLACLPAVRNEQLHATSSPAKAPAVATNNKEQCRLSL